MSDPQQFKPLHAFGPPQEGSDTDAGLITRDELLAGFRLIHGEADAEEWTASLWFGDSDEGVFFWSDDTLVLVSLVSTAIAERIRSHRGWSQADLTQRQAEFRRMSGLRDGT